jgi:hypothetical protein
VAARGYSVFFRSHLCCVFALCKKLHAKKWQRELSRYELIRYAVVFILTAHVISSIIGFRVSFCHTLRCFDHTYWFKKKKKKIKKKSESVFTTTGYASRDLFFSADVFFYRETRTSSPKI